MRHTKINLELRKRLGDANPTVKPTTKNERQEMSAKVTMARDYRTGQWRPASILKLTPKSRNYVNGGAYIQWDDVNLADLSQSQGGWVPMSSLRDYGDLSAIPMAAY